MNRHSPIELDSVLAIMRIGSFRAAAVELGMSTTALSDAIGKLEPELGVRVFHRTTRSVSLTMPAAILSRRSAPRCRTSTRRWTPPNRSRKRHWACCASTPFPPRREILTPLVLQFLRRHPRVHVDLVTEGRLVDIVADGFDLGVRSADLVPSDMIAVPAGGPRRFAVAASPAYFRAHAKPQVPPDLLGHACIPARRPNGALYRWHFEKDGQPVQIDVSGPITFDEASLSRAAVRDDVGIGFFMETDMRDDIAAGRLICVLEDWTPPLAPLCHYYPSRRNPSAAFRAFIDLAREATREAEMS
ncbi:DNA-binding transcriptional LysR family regulator [Sphingomonas zeicaulis]